MIICQFYVKNSIFAHMTDKNFPVTAPFGDPCPPLPFTVHATNNATTALNGQPVQTVHAACRPCCPTPWSVNIDYCCDVTRTYM